MLSCSFLLTLLHCHFFIYKFQDAPNTFTENGYTKAHLENTKSIIHSINNTIFSSITHSRNLHDIFNHKVWQAVHDYGTLTASNAQEVKLIDHLSRIDPFSELVLLNQYQNKVTNDSNNNKNEKENDKSISKERLTYLKKAWTWFLNEHRFTANKMESFESYCTILTKRKKWLKRRYEWNRMLTNAAKKSSAMEALLSAIGMTAPHFNIDKVRRK